MNLDINGLTYNVAEVKAPSSIGNILLRSAKPDLFIVSLQEVDLALQLGRLLFWDQWTAQITKGIFQTNIDTVKFLPKLPRLDLRSDIFSRLFMSIRLFT